VECLGFGEGYVRVEGRSNMADPPPEMRKKIRVSFRAFLSSARLARAAAKAVFIGKRVPAFKVTDAPVAVLGNLVIATDAAQALAALHALEQCSSMGPAALPRAITKMRL